MKMIIINFVFQQIEELRKENFDLKLRIYYMYLEESHIPRDLTMAAKQDLKNKLAEAEKVYIYNLK